MMRLAAASLLLLGLPLHPAQAAAADLSATVVVAPENAGVLGSGDLHVSVGVSNDGSTTIPAGTVRLALEQATAADGATLVERLGDPTPYGQLQGYGVGTAASPSLAPGQRTVVRLTVPAAVAGAYTKDPGAHLLAAQLRVGDTAVAAGAAVATRAPTGSAAVRLAAVIPMTLPVALAPTGLADAALVTALTDQGGAWSDALAAAAADPSAILELDPAVLASIRLLGSAAPQSATDLLAGLQALPNPTVELPYADGDVTLERAAGSSHVLGPTGFTGTLAFPARSAAPAPTVTPTPGPVSAATSSPTRWSWASPRIAWPVPGTASAADLPFLARSGYGVTLLSSADVQDTAARRSAGPLATVDGSKVLVSDDDVSRLLATATSERGPEGDEAVASLVGLLAVEATTAGTPTVLAAASRTGDDGDRLGTVLGLLRSLGWVHDATLGDLLAGRPAAVSMSQHAVPAATTARARAVVQADSAVQRLSAAITTHATTVTAPYRLAALAMLGAGWRSADASWAEQVGPVAAGLDSFAHDSVRLLPLTTVNYLGVSGGLPVSVHNSLPEPVHVHITGVPSNGRIIVQGAYDGTVGADQTSPTLKLPTRSISNGQVQIRLELSTPAGQRLGRPVTATVTVNAGWDTLGAGIFLAALLALFGVGVYRNLTRRRRRARAAVA